MEQIQRHQKISENALPNNDALKGKGKGWLEIGVSVKF